MRIVPVRHPWTTISNISRSILGRGELLQRIRVENLRETGFDHPEDDTGYALPYEEQKEPLTPTCCLASIIVFYI